jgi:hypothetical protein
MDQRTDRLTATYVDLAVNVVTAFGLNAGVRVLHEHKTPPPVVQRVLIDGTPRRSAPDDLPRTCRKTDGQG